MGRSSALEVIEEETKAKRDKLKAEKAELEKKKTEAPVEEEVTPEAEEAPVEETVEAEPTVEEQPTVGTIRTKVGVEAFGKLEAAVRSYLDYINTVNRYD
jgi:hypothetical protein